MYVGGREGGGLQALAYMRSGSTVRLCVAKSMAAKCTVRLAAGMSGRYSKLSLRKSQNFSDDGGGVWQRMEAVGSAATIAGAFTASLGDHSIRFAAAASATDGCFPLLLLVILSLLPWSGDAAWH